MAKRNFPGLTFEYDPAFSSSKKAKLDLNGVIVNELTIAYAVLFPPPPPFDRRPSTSSDVAHSIGMEDVRPSAVANVSSATANVSLAVVDVPDDIDNGQDKDASFWLKKCATCALFGHSRSNSSMCPGNPNNAHRRESMRQEFIILHGLSVSPTGDLIRPDTPPLPIAKRLFAENMVFGEDVLLIVIISVRGCSANTARHGSGSRRECLQNVPTQSFLSAAPKVVSLSPKSCPIQMD
ncbi:MAG: hypothetical protein J3R72DRAFT_491642 [Linnemannia gamsii]|nr:MAG: hypothetical protein J3R72DRAFT_491642 [Linnemannia gamsii]